MHGADPPGDIRRETTRPAGFPWAAGTGKLAATRTGSPWAAGSGKHTGGSPDFVWPRVPVVRKAEERRHLTEQLLVVRVVPRLVERELLVQVSLFDVG